MHNQQKIRNQRQKMKQMGFPRGAKLFVVIAIFVIALSAIVFANIDDEIREKEQEREEIMELLRQSEENLRNSQEVISEINIRIVNTNNEIARIAAEIDAFNVDIEVTEEAIAKKEEELKVAEKNLAEKMELLNKRLRVMYKFGTVGYIEVLLGADSFHELLSRADVLQKIVSQDQKLITDMKEYRDEVDKAKQALEEKRQHLVELRTAQEVKHEEYLGLSADLNAYWQQAQADKESLEELIREREEAMAAIDEAIEYLELSKMAYVGGPLHWPVPGNFEITSYFGWRTIPFAGFHTGIDIAAWTGTPVVSAQTGIVVKAQYLNSYGNTVMIDHGGNKLTLYAHLNTIDVVLGQEVVRGERIGTIGSTGLSTGPHLHFEVREGKEYTNPIEYFSDLF